MPSLGHGFMGTAVVGGISSFMVTLLWVAVALMIVWMILAATQKPSGTGSQMTRPVTVGADPAVQIVRDRFARGEIDRAEYERLVTGLLFRT